MMDTGRELDALVAEKVMGLANVVYRSGHFAGGRKWEGASSGEGDDQQSVPAFSTDISAAWTVVERLRKSYTRVEVHLVGAGACVLLATGDDVTESYPVAAEAGTTPLAICLAALEAAAEIKTRGSDTPE